MNADERAALEVLARKATPGPWRTRGPTLAYQFRVDVAANCLPPVVVGDREEDAAYIAAASPDVVLGLLADLAIARRRADWRVCDVAACNCGSGHFHAPTRADVETLHGELALANQSCRDYADESAEARAEIAAYQGRPEGALPGWRTYAPTGGYRRAITGGLGQLSSMLHADPALRVANGWSWSIGSGTVGVAAKDDAPTPRAAMRAAEAAAKARGWLTADEVSRG